MAEIKPIQPVFFPLPRLRQDQLTQSYLLKYGDIVKGKDKDISLNLFLFYFLSLVIFSVVIMLINN